MTAFGAFLIVAGSLLALVAAVGVVRFDTTLARLHAASKPATLGMALAVAGAAMVNRSIQLAEVALMVVLFQFLTTPIAGHMVGRAAYLSGNAPGLDPDELSTAPSARLSVLKGARAPRLLVAATVVVVWMLLWRDLSFGALVGGLLVATVLLGPRLGAATLPVETIRLVPALRFLVWYVWDLLRANTLVAWEVVTPNNDDIREAIVEVEIRTPALIPLVANAITFTPGTLTVDVGTEGDTLFVHVLHFREVEAVRRSILELERRAQAAFAAS
ncbi:MAG: monovalent cation/H(+) antiporter subunit G [Acidimicrobiia bacterium]|jgi:monovalent cation/proton antiporter MnhG/PhaG subunit